MVFDGFDGGGGGSEVPAPYHLGVDLGTTWTAAAVWRGGRARVAELGTRAPVVPSVVLLTAEGRWLVGEAAAARAPLDSARVAREFKRRVGDPAPLVLGTSVFPAPELMARLLRWVVDRVAEQEGGPPRSIAVAVPANWGNFKNDLLRRAIELVGLPGAGLVVEPVAAAIHYASQDRVSPGAVVAVYDLGGGTFDAAVLRRIERGWQVLGPPQGIEHLGGIDFDEAVFQHVLTGPVARAVAALDPGGVATRGALARLRQECIDAKEALAMDTDVAIPVLLPNLRTAVRLTRSELEEMVRPALADTVVALRSALRAAGAAAGDLDRVLLVGGSSRMPLVAQVIGGELGCPVSIDVHPQHAVALGAARVAARGVARPVSPPRPRGSRPAGPPARPAPPLAAPVPVARPAPQPAPERAVRAAPQPAPERAVRAAAQPASERAAPAAADPAPGFGDRLAGPSAPWPAAPTKPPAPPLPWAQDAPDVGASVAWSPPPAPATPAEAPAPTARPTQGAPDAGTPGAWVPPGAPRLPGAAGARAPAAARTEVAVRPGLPAPGSPVAAGGAAPSPGPASPAAGDPAPVAVWGSVPPAAAYGGDQPTWVLVADDIRPDAWSGEAWAATPPDGRRRRRLLLIAAAAAAAVAISSTAAGLARLPEPDESVRTLDTPGATSAPPTSATPVIGAPTTPAAPATVPGATPTAL